MGVIIFSFLKKLIPLSVAQAVRPYWWQAKVLWEFFRDGGRARYSWRLSGWIVSRVIDGKRMEVVVRSYREFRRFTRFDEDDQDVVQSWIRRIRDCDTLWDIGSANGLEGMFAHHYHGANVVFLEPYSPSIETILKSIYNVKERTNTKANLEVVQAFCDSASGYQRMVMHDRPVAGVTLNTAEDGLDDYCHGGRKDLDVSVSQWVASVSLDDLLEVHQLPAPSHVKIDIDGFEERALAGAQKLLSSQRVKEWVIEVNDNRGPRVEEEMRKHGYFKQAEYNHGKPGANYTADYIFTRTDPSAASPAT